MLSTPSRSAEIQHRHSAIIQVTVEPYASPCLRLRYCYYVSDICDEPLSIQTQAAILLRATWAALNLDWPAGHLLRVALLTEISLAQHIQTIKHKIPR
jgi:hypothetical protein